MPETPGSLPQVSLPRVSGQEVARAIEVVRGNLPPADRLIFYGALGAMAAFGAVDWPVAGAIGVGTWVARRSRNGSPGGS